jgi:proline iminopeptidase
MDLARLAKELDLEPLALVGYSWGGLLALLYATEQRRSDSLPSIRLLVAIDPAPATRPYRQEFEQEFARRMRSDALRQLREELATSGLRERDPESYRRRQFELAVAPYFARPELATELTAFRVSGKVQQSVWESLGDYDAISSAASLRLPALVVHGRHDPIPLRSSQEVADAMRARFLVLENSGHVPFIEQPDALFTAVEQFLTEYIPGS